MTDLNEIKEVLESTIRAIDRSITLEIELDKSYGKFMENAKSIEIGLLKRPNLLTSINQLKLQKEIMTTLKFHVECQIDDNKKKGQKSNTGISKENIKEEKGETI